MEILVAVALLSILILVHELGHFFTARKAGILVEEFGIGLPPRLLGFRKNGTLYSINALPFGGFVRLHGETGLETGLEPSRAFFAKSLDRRLTVLLAGVAMNFLLGAALLAVLFTVGVPAAASPETAATLGDRHIEIIAVAAGSPAGIAGLEAGDRITALSAASGNLPERGLTIEAVRDFVNRNAGRELTIGIRRGTEDLEIDAVPRVNPPADEGPLGIAMADVGILRYPWYRSVFEGILTAVRIASNTFAALWFILKDLVTEGRVGPSVAGPIGIVQLAGEAARLGIVRLLNFAAILSINLAVLNVLPIPALDGGRLLFLGIERFRGKPVSRRTEQVAHAIGMAVLLGLIFLITIYDIRRL